MNIKCQVEIWEFVGERPVRQGEKDKDGRHKIQIARIVGKCGQPAVQFLDSPPGGLTAYCEKHRASVNDRPLDDRLLYTSIALAFLCQVLAIISAIQFDLKLLATSAVLAMLSAVVLLQWKKQPRG